MRPANDGLRFVLELAVLAALVGWGASAVGGVVGWAVGICLAVAMAVVWVTFVNPNGARRPPDPARLCIEVGVFGAGVLALLGADREALAAALAALAAVHLALTFALGQRGVAEAPKF